MDPITIAAIIAAVVALGSTGASIAANSRAAKRQEEHDYGMLEASQENAKEMFDYENSFNKYSNAKSQMVEAGFNPALMYGQMPEVLSQSAASGSAGNVGMKPSFDGITRAINPTQIADLKIAEANGVAARNQANSEARLADGRYMEALANAQAKTYDTHVKKLLEDTIIDTATANLHRTRAETASIRTNTSRVELLTPVEYEEVLSRVGLNNEQASKVRSQVEQIKEDIKNQPLYRNQLAAQARYYNKAAEEVETRGRLEASERQEIERRIQSYDLERLARECGLTRRRPGKEAKSARELEIGKSSYESERSLLDPNEKAFCIGLMRCGFTEYEALTATYYYTFGTLDDLTKDWLQAGSKALGTAAGLGIGLSTAGKVTKGGSRGFTQTYSN